MHAECPKCHHKFDVATKDTDEYGFVMNSKGSFIANLIAKKPGIKLTEILMATENKYPTENSIGRIQSVINNLKKSKRLVADGNSFKMVKVPVKA